MKTKFLLPMITMIFVIGMSFATSELKNESEVLALDYYKVGNTWYSVAEQNCGEGDFTCRVQSGATGTPHDLFDNMGDIQPKPSASPDPIIIP